MKIGIFSIIVAAMFALSSCSQMNEQKYNDTVANMYTAYSNNVTSKMMAISNSSDKQKSLADLKSVEKVTDSCIGVMNSLKPSEAAKDFHQKVLAVFQTVKTGFIPLAGKMLRMNSTQDVDAYNKLIDEFNELSTKINQVESDARSAQQVYGSKVGMQIK